MHLTRTDMSPQGKRSGNRAAIDADCYCTQFRRAANSLTNIYDHELQVVGLKVTQFSMLRALKRLGAGTFTELAKEAALDKTTISRSLKLLVAAGWVNLESDDDGRFKVASLSQAGTLLLRKAEQLWRRAQRRVAGSMVAFKGQSAVAELIRSLEALDAERSGR